MKNPPRIDVHPEKKTSSLDLETVGLLVVASGAAALAHQLLWTRRMIDLLGASTASTTHVLGCFFLGLAIGAAIAATKAGRVQNPLRWAGIAQIGMAVMTLPVMTLPSWADFVWPAIGPDALAGHLGASIKFCFAVFAILPPATLMGFSFPMIVAGTLRGHAVGHSRDSLWLYASNTAGGALGLFVVMLIALPWLGLFTSMMVATAVDFVVGVVLLRWSKHKRDPGEHSSQGLENTDSFEMDSLNLLRLWAPLALAFFSGAVVLALEVISMQMFMLVATLSLYAPAAILFSVIVFLACAASLVSSVPDPLKVAERMAMNLLVTMLVASALVVVSPLLFMLVVTNFNAFGSNVSILTFALKLIALAMFSMGPAWIVVGMLFPLTIHYAEAIAQKTEAASSSRSASRLGWLLAVNGIGGFLGAELALRFLLPTSGIYGSIVAIAIVMASIATGGLVLLVVRQQGRTYYGLAAALTLVMVATVGVYFVSELRTSNLPAKFRLLDTAVGPEGVVSVVSDENNERSILMSNQYSLGGTSVRFDQERQMLLPLLMHPSPKRVVAIGLATGITAGAALTLKDIEQVTAIELSPLVVRAADKFFHHENYGVTRDPRANIVVEDGRTYIASAVDAFDVIEGDLFLPWAPGEVRLYSREHFLATKKSLTQGGVYCQWLAMYQLTPDQFQAIATTFQDVFPNTFLMLNHFRGVSPVLALIGFQDDRDQMPWQTIENRCQAMSATDQVRDPVLRRGEAFQLLYLGKWEPDVVRRAELVTLADPSLEFSTASVRIAGDPGKNYFYMSRWLEFCRSRQKTMAGGRSGEDPGLLRTASLCGGLMELDFAISVKHPAAKAIGKSLRAEMPVTIRKDDAADWNRWPGSEPDWR